MLYSPKMNAFLLPSEGSLEQAPDAIEVEEGIFDEFGLGQPPEGKIRVAGTDGLPAWGDIPPPTPDEIISQVESKRQALLIVANKTTEDWRTELALDIISDEDKKSLTEWMIYIKAVKSVDTQNPRWPDSPK